MKMYHPLGPDMTPGPGRMTMTHVMAVAVSRRTIAWSLNNFTSRSLYQPTGRKWLRRSTTGPSRISGPE